MLLVGCADTYQSYGRHTTWTPTDIFMDNIPDGHDSYSQGFRDGCNTAYGNIGSGLLQSHAVGLDPNRGIEDQEYYLGYRMGYNYCTYYLDPDPL